MKTKTAQHLTVKRYRYQWNTEDKVVAKIDTTVCFPTFGVGSVAKMTGITDPETYRQAHRLWLKLKDAFNAEAATYIPTAYESKLGSVGNVERREVLRTAWWDELNGDAYGDYSELTIIIEILHDHEKLETGRILFGS